jgi:hypothetical protein
MDPTNSFQRLTPPPANPLLIDLRDTRPYDEIAAEAVQEAIKCAEIAEQQRAKENPRRLKSIARLATAIPPSITN